MEIVVLRLDKKIKKTGGGGEGRLSKKHQQHWGGHFLKKIAGVGVF